MACPPTGTRDLWPNRQQQRQAKRRSSRKRKDAWCPRALSTFRRHSTTLWSASPIRRGNWCAGRARDRWAFEDHGKVLPSLRSRQLTALPAPPATTECVPWRYASKGPEPDGSLLFALWLLSGSKSATSKMRRRFLITAASLLSGGECRKLADWLTDPSSLLGSIS